MTSSRRAATRAVLLASLVCAAACSAIEPPSVVHRDPQLDLSRFETPGLVLGLQLAGSGDFDTCGAELASQTGAFTGHPVSIVAWSEGDRGAVDAVFRV